MSNHYLIFDRAQVRKHRNRAAARFEQYDTVLREAGLRLIERLDDINRQFPLALELGCHTGFLGQLLRGHPKIGTLIQSDLSEGMLARAEGPRVVCDEEFLPFADHRFDLVISALSLHWVNDLPGTLIQIQRMLKPDGLLLLSLPGGETLRELQAAMLSAASGSGLSPRVSPFVDLRDAGALLQRAGFALPVVDSEWMHISYEHPLALMKELQGAGESNALLQRDKHFTPRGELLAIAQHYAPDAEGRTSATLELLTLTAWKPHDSQQQPAKRGSGKVNLGEILKN